MFILTGTVSQDIPIPKVTFPVFSLKTILMRPWQEEIQATT